MNKKMIPMYLTFSRIGLVIPIVLLILHDTKTSDWLAAFLWIIAGITDALDGYFARKHSTQTVAGALLDSAADKILTSSILIILCYLQKIDPFLLILFISRDMYISSLRAIAANKGLILYSKPLAKWKTALQIIGIFMMLVGTHLSVYIEQTAYGLLWVSVLMSGISAWNYTTACRKKIKIIEFTN